MVEHTGLELISVCSPVNKNALFYGHSRLRAVHLSTAHRLILTEILTKRKSLPTQSREADSFPEVNMVRTE